MTGWLQILLALAGGGVLNEVFRWQRSRAVSVGTAARAAAVAAQAHATIETVAIEALSGQLTAQGKRIDELDRQLGLVRAETRAAQAHAESLMTLLHQAAPHCRAGCLVPDYLALRDRQ